MIPVRDEAGSIDVIPGRVSQSVAITAAFVVVLLLQSPLHVATVLAIAGGGVLGFATARQGVEAIHVGAVVQLLAVVAAALEGIPSWRLVIATAFVVIGWESARYGLLLARNVGQDADTKRLELVHHSNAIAVGAGGSAIIYAGFLFAVGTRSVPALLLLFGGVIAAGAAFR